MRRILGLLLVIATVVLVGCAKSDHDDQVIQPKPWSPPGGAAKYGGGNHGAPSKPPPGTTAPDPNRPTQSGGTAK